MKEGNKDKRRNKKLELLFKWLMGIRKILIIVTMMRVFIHKMIKTKESQ